MNEYSNLRIVWGNTLLENRLRIIPEPEALRDEFLIILNQLAEFASKKKRKAAIAGGLSLLVPIKGLVRSVHEGINHQNDK